MHPFLKLYYDQKLQLISKDGPQGTLLPGIYALCSLLWGPVTVFPWGFLPISSFAFIWVGLGLKVESGDKNGQIYKMRREDKLKGSCGLTAEIHGKSSVPVSSAIFSPTPRKKQTPYSQVLSLLPVSYSHCSHQENLLCVINHHKILLIHISTQNWFIRTRHRDSALQVITCFHTCLTPHSSPRTGITIIVPIFQMSKPRYRVGYQRSYCVTVLRLSERRQI